MENFTFLLNQAVSSCNLTPAQLAINTGIERSTVYQYLNGKRKLKSRAHFDRILQQLPLSYTERCDLEAAWQVQAYGEDIYFQKQYLEHFTETLLTVAQLSVSAWDEAEVQKAPPRFSGAETNLIGKTRVVEALVDLLTYAPEGKPVYILMQPEHGVLTQVLMTPIVYHHSLQLNLITRLNKPQDRKYRNIPVLEQIIKYLALYPDCRPLCYYSDEDDSRSQIIPGNLVLTGQAAMLISDDGSFAFLIKDPDMHQLLAKRISSLAEHCSLIGTTSPSGFDQVSYLFKLYSQIDFTSFFELSGLFCISIFLSPEMILRNINPLLPRHEELAAQYAQLCALFLEKEKAQPVTILSGISTLRTFTDTGIMPSIPKLFMPQPFSVTIRLELLGRIRQAILDGWYHLRLFKEDIPLLNDHFDIISSPSLLHIELCCKDNKRYFGLTEPTLVGMFAQYMQTIVETDIVTTEEETIALLEQEISRLQEKAGSLESPESPEIPES